MQQLTLDPQSTTMLRISELAQRPPLTWLPAWLPSWLPTWLFDSACVILFLQLAPPCDAQQVDFVREVRPILESHCYPCHGPQKQKSSLRFDVKAAAMRGGENYGPCIVPNEPASSPLIELVTSDDLEVRMPPQGPPLPKESIQILRGWIEQGALWPDGIDPTQ